MSISPIILAGLIRASRIGLTRAYTYNEKNKGESKTKTRTIIKHKNGHLYIQTNGILI